MLAQPCRPFRLVVITALLAIAGCADDPVEGPFVNEEAAATEARALFAAGFGDTGEAVGATAADSPGPTGYDADPGIRREAASTLAENLRRNFSLAFAARDPEDFLRSGAASDIADRALEMRGLPSNDLIGATVLMFGLAWELANGKALFPAQQQGLLAQTRAKIAVGKDEAGRQREAETRLMIAALWLEEVRLRQGSPKAMQQLSDAIWRDMKRMSGSDLRAHDVGTSGFVER